MSNKTNKLQEGITCNEIRDNHLKVFYGIKYKTDAQENYGKSIDKNTITFGIGPAGTGKTYIAIAKSLDHISKDENMGILILRPPVEVGPKMGHLPGDVDEKMAPHNEVIEETIIKHIGIDQYKKYLEKGRIQYKCVGYQRGSNFINKIVILDESQNLTKGQLKMLLTRLSDGSKIIINGDSDQTDIHNSGLDDCVLRMTGLKDTKVCQFTDDDSVRHELVKEILKRYR